MTYRERLKMYNIFLTRFNNDKRSVNMKFYGMICLSVLLLAITFVLAWQFAPVILASFWLKIALVIPFLLSLTPVLEIYLSPHIYSIKFYTTQEQDAGYSTIQGLINKVYCKPETYAEKIKNIPENFKPSNAFEEAIVESKKIYNRFKSLCFNGVSLNAEKALEIVASLKLVNYGSSGSCFRSLLTERDFDSILLASKDTAGNRYTLSRDILESNTEGQMIYRFEIDGKKTKDLSEFEISYPS